MNLSFVLDSMEATGYPIPEYVHYRRKDAAASEHVDPDDSVLDSREKVWLATVKLAVTPMRKLQKTFLFHKIAAAAARYGIHKETQDAVAWVDRLDKRVDGIRTVADFQKAADWLRKYANVLDPDVRSGLAGHLLEKSVKLGHVLSTVERFELDEWAGRDPMTSEVRDLADRHLYKLATGNVYRTDQFAGLQAEELRDCLSDLVQKASLGMEAIKPERLGKCAALLPEHEARVLDALMESRGQRPIHSDDGAPIVIDDAILASL